METKIKVPESFYDVIYLAGCAVNSIIPDNTRIGKMEIDEVFSISERHMVSALISYALESCGYSNERTKQYIIKAVHKMVVMDTEKKILLSQLEKNGIWYMPLKGVVLKDFYPKFGMREMSDFDILYDSKRAEDLRTILEKQGFTTSSFGEHHHDVFKKPPVCCFEMHRTLYEESKKEELFWYYLRIKERLYKDSNNQYGFHFSPEDFYIYIVSHAYAHYSGHGTGLRSLLDIYVILEKYSNILDMKYVEKESTKMGISDFERESRKLSMRLFNNPSSFSKEENAILSFIYNAGAYGTTDNRVAYRVYEMGGGILGKTRFLLIRIFPPLTWIRKNHPLIYKTKILIPAIPLIRISEALTSKRNITISEMKAIKK